MVRFTAVIHQEDAMYVAFCPEIGTASQGVTAKKALANLKYLEEFPEYSNKSSVVATFEVDGAKA